MSVCSYHRINLQSKCTEQDPDNEQRYLEITRPYEKKELTIFAKAMGELVLNVSKDPYSDLLGRYFTENVTSGHNGQFFTPEPVCDLMTRLASGAQTVEHKSVLDPAVGSGRLLMSFAKLHPRNLFYAADSSSTCAQMTVLNMFLNGMRGEVAHMNSLSMSWHTGWEVNMEGIGIQPIDCEKSRIWKSPQILDAQTEAIGQLTLF